ncbi:MAG: Rrf2 family transcriptional regulator [Candidatus Shapirobacteria bacterium]
MLSFTKKVDYGLELMLALARSDGQPLSLRQVSRQSRLPYAFLTQVAVELRRAGLIEAKEGATGGYFLACPPEKINLAEIVAALNGDSAENCEVCEREGICRPRQIWAEIEDELAQKFKNRTLKDLIK